MSSKYERHADPASANPLTVWILLLGALIIMLILVVRGRIDKPVPSSTNSTISSITNSDTTIRAPQSRARRERPRPDSFPAKTAAEIVAEKLAQFSRNHESIVAAIAKKQNVLVPPDVGRFFAAVQAGNWAETTNLFAALQTQRETNPAFQPLWNAITETYGVADQVHLWPAQALLDYGNAILGSLRPGMVYVGGTDAGRFIPTLLTDTSEGDTHIVLTQNALADNSYVDYLRFRYGDQLELLSAEDSQQGFSSYLQDAQKRLQHDQAFPDEPRQLLPGEDIRISDNRVQVSGQVAVMQINELLLRNLLQKNPDTNFALQESMPFKSLYGGASTLGPITELPSDADSTLTSDRASESLDYWRATTQSLLADSESDASTTVREAYAKLILGQANLFLNRQFSAEAEQAFQYATTLSPAQPEAVTGYAGLLINQKRFAEAAQVVQNALTQAPDNAQFRALASQINKLL